MKGRQEQPVSHLWCTPLRRISSTANSLMATSMFWSMVTIDAKTNGHFHTSFPFHCVYPSWSYCCRAILRGCTQERTKGGGEIQGDQGYGTLTPRIIHFSPTYAKLVLFLQVLKRGVGLFLNRYRIYVSAVSSKTEALSASKNLCGQFLEVKDASLPLFHSRQELHRQCRSRTREKSPALSLSLCRTCPPGPGS